MRFVNLGVFVFGFFILLTLMDQSTVDARGIIIGKGSEIRPLFRDASLEEIEAFGKKLSGSYSSVILHLGQLKAFERGGLFFYRTSQKNLSRFSKVLSDNNTELILWMLDSYGADAFDKMYSRYQDVVTHNAGFLDKLGVQFSGVIIDLEWINHPEGHNADRLEEILRFIKSIFKGKQVMAFAPLIDDDNENIRRGYHQSKLKSLEIRLVPMLYIVDGGFAITDGQVKPYLHDGRIDQLKRYYQSKGYRWAVSLEGGIVVRKKGQIRFFALKKPERQALLDISMDRVTHRSDYYEINEREAIKDFTIGKEGLISQNQIFYLFQVNQSIITSNDFIWHYHLLNTP